MTGPSLFLVLCFGSLAGALMQSLVIPIQSDLPRLLGTDPGNASWAVTATLLAAAVTMPVTGRLADMYGKKKVMVVSAGILVVGSLIAALSSSLAPFLVGRALQGMAMGYIPVAISMVREVAPPERVVTTERWGPEWPETVNTVVFTETAGQTTIRLTITYPSKEARDAALQTGMKEGMEQGFARLDHLLGTLR